MKVQLVKGETKHTFGEGENGFDYYTRPLTVEEKETVSAHIAWKAVKGRMTVDFKNTDKLELVSLAVTRLDRLYDSDDQKIDTIGKLLSLTAEPGFLNNVVLTMWIEIWTGMSLSEEVKKKLSPDSAPAAEA